MAHSRAYFLGFVYGVPLGFSLTILLLMTVINKRLNWRLLRSVLGVDLDDEKKKKKPNEESRPALSANLPADPKTEDNASDSFKTYLYIEFNEEAKGDSTRLTVIQRIASDLLVSAILGVFVTIIFNALVLSSESVENNDNCPDYDASCFGNDGKQDVGPFDCEKGNTTNFGATSKSWWCVGWVYQDKTAKDVLDTLGTCGGLLGLVSSIVPIVYYLTYHKNCCCPFSVTWIVPLLTPAALGFLGWYASPLGPSILAVITLSVVIAMVFVGWTWATARSFKDSRCCPKLCPKRNCCEAFPFKRFFSKLGQPSDSYPWCCCPGCSSNVNICYRCCYHKLPSCRPCLDCCCENETDKMAKRASTIIIPPVRTNAPVEILSSTKQTRPIANAYPKTAW